jgi:catechol 2,3-dioxygenase-like lactoylglutathione lyase family enzyme
MDQRLNFITLGVTNLPLMREFYIEKFGWKPMQDDEGIVFFRLNGLVLALYPYHELAEDIGTSVLGDGFKRFSLSINFDSIQGVDRAFRQLVERGVRPVRDPEKVFWGGYRGYIADPEDNYWELAHNPYLTLDAEGNVASPEIED